MKLEVTTEAAKWYASEMDLKPGDYIRFIVKLYGGIPTPHSDYYLGVSIGKEGTIAIKDVAEGITFYFTDQDAWFLDDYNMKVIEKDDDVEYIFE